jgi:hypothetical protein
MTFDSKTTNVVLLTFDSISRFTVKCQYKISRFTVNCQEYNISRFTVKCQEDIWQLND